MALVDPLIDKVRDKPLSDNCSTKGELSYGPCDYPYHPCIRDERCCGFAASLLAVDNPPGHTAAQWRSEGLPGPPAISVRTPVNTTDSYAVLPPGCKQATCATTITLTSVATDGSETTPDASALETPSPSGAALDSAIRAGRRHHPTGAITLLLSHRELQGPEIVTMAMATKLPIIHITKTAREHSCLPVIFNILPRLLRIPTGKLLHSRQPDEW